MANLAILEKIEAIADSPKTRFMRALALAIPQNVGMLPAALVRCAVTAIKANPGLQKCSEYSVFGSIAEVAQTGLSLDKYLGQAFLVPFSGECTVMYGYRGLQTLAYRSGMVTELVGEIRYAKDKFRIQLGTDRRLIHEYPDLPVSKRGQILGAYAIATLYAGRPIFEYMDIEQINAIRDAVLKRKKPGSKPSPWEIEGAVGEMIRKTPVRRLAKRVPQSVALMPFVQASVRDEYRDAGVATVLDVTPAIAEALEHEGIEPTKQADARESEIEEVQETGTITQNQADDLYTLATDLGVPDLRKLLVGVRHKGALNALPKSKLAQVHKAIERYKE